ncbi:MAG: hypothetical protein ACK41C_18565 [Phenylobacterium sp.]|uniref:hypothetical protein n=1 Tax=Phenylobacterium sp. TaxID=1871053 RepID=UPI00391ACB09
MSLIALAAAAAVSATQAGQPASATAPVAEPMRMTAVLLDCQVKETGLTDCKALDAEGATAEAAVKMAAQVEVSEAFALANPGRIVLRMTVTN